MMLSVVVAQRTEAEVGRRGDLPGAGPTEQRPGRVRKGPEVP